MAVDKLLKLVEKKSSHELRSHAEPVSDTEAEAAVRLLIEWAGEDPSRDGLVETPKRYLNSWKEFFKGYKEDPREHLRKTFGDMEGYEGPITLQNVSFETYCEHHLVPFVGEAFISYIPNSKIVGISKLVRVLDGFAKRMQVQERLTAQVAQTIEQELEPKGVAVAIRSEHFCMKTRGVRRAGAQMLTVTCLGEFRTNKLLKEEFMIGVNSSRYQVS